MPSSRCLVFSTASLCAAAAGCNCTDFTDAEEHYYKKQAAKDECACADFCTADLNCGFANFAHGTCYLKNTTTLTPIWDTTGVMLCVPDGRPSPPLPPAPPAPPPTPPPADFPYDVEIFDKPVRPALSIANPVGQGYSPCEYTFNPAWLQSSPGLNRTALLVRAAKCPNYAGGSGDHIMFAYCEADGTCGDLQNMTFPFEQNAEDPRVIFDGEHYILYYYAKGSGESTVYVRRSKTPLDPNSWELIAGPLAWHRNGCVLLNQQPPHQVIFGESPPLKGLGIANTTDFMDYVVIDDVWLTPDQGPELTEQVIEASTPVVKLSTGDYMHLYSAGTKGWIENGNYTAGWVIMDKDDPTKIIQRGAHHILCGPCDRDWELGVEPYPVQRKRTTFVTSIVPLEGEIDTFRIWYGAADASVGTAKLRVIKKGDKVKALV